MKTIYKMTLLAACFLILYSCKYEINIKTRLHPDGSITRTMVSIGDSSKINAPDIFPVSIDSTWSQNLEWKKDSTSDRSQFMITVTKTFPNVESLNRELSNNSVSGIKTTVQVRKKFAWFFTKYQYTEVYEKIFPFDHFPVTDYFTEDEINREILDIPDSSFYAKMDSIETENYKDSMDSTLIRFYSDNFAAELIQVYNEIDSAQLISANITANNLSYHILNDIANFYDKFPDTFEGLIQITDSVYGTNYRMIYASQPQYFSKFEAKIDALGDLFNIPYSNQNMVELPGILLETNANKTMNGQLAWQFTGDHYAYQDFVIQAESRVLNKWTIFTSALIVLLAGLSFMVRRRR